MVNYSRQLQTNKSVKITGGEFLVNLLINEKVDTIFGYPGAPILPIYDALSKTTEIKHILTRHEQGAIHAAEGYAKAKNKCGVVLVTSGPGVTNTITGIINAYTDQTPVVIIAGMAETCDENEFQDVNIEKLTKNHTKETFSLKNISDMEKVVKTAFSKAMTYPQGPCVIAVTKSVLNSAIEDKTEFKLKKDIKVEAPHSCVLKAIDTLQKANKPLIIIGGGCKDADNEIRELTQLTHIPVVNTLMATGIADNISLGLIGTNGENELNNKIKNADIVLALGVRFSNRTTNNDTKFLQNSKIISINISHNKSKNVSTSKEIIGEMNIILQQIIGTIKSKNILFDIHYDWIEQLSNTNTNSINNDNELTVQYVLNEIHNYTKKYRPIITTDVGEHQICCAKIFKTNSARNFLTSGGLGTMGFGLPAAIGAQIARPNALVLNITGDGSFQMNIQELATCSEYNLPIKIILLNNSSLGMIKTMQEKDYNNCYKSNLINPDFTKISNAYGILGYNIKSKEDLKQALKEIFTYKKAVLLNIQTNK